MGDCMFESMNEYIHCGTPQTCDSSAVTNPAVAALPLSPDLID